MPFRSVRGVGGRSMSKSFRKIDPRIWNDEKFRTMSDSGKLLFFFLLTHPAMTPLGAMRATVEGLAAELHWNQEAFREAFGEALAKGLAEYDQEACFLGIPKYLKYNRPESPNVAKAWAKSVDLIPECGLQVALMERVKGFIEGLSKAFREALPEDFLEALPKGAAPSSSSSSSSSSPIYMRHPAQPGTPETGDPPGHIYKIAPAPQRTEPNQDEDTEPDEDRNAEDQPGVRTALGRYSVLFEGKTRTKPVLTRRDTGILKRLVRTCGLDEVLLGLEWFFQGRDEFVAKAAFALPAIASCWGKYQARDQVSGAADSPPYLKPARVETGPQWGGENPENRAKLSEMLAAAKARLAPQPSPPPQVEPPVPPPHPEGGNNAPPATA